MDRDTLTMANAALDDAKSERQQLEQRMNDLLARIQAAPEAERGSQSFKAEYLEIVRLQGELGWKMLATVEALSKMPKNATD
jgi:septal ring factor EnvC (AmiA/AmiB activator)